MLGYILYERCVPNLTVEQYERSLAITIFNANKMIMFDSRNIDSSELFQSNIN